MAVPTWVSSCLMSSTVTGDPFQQGGHTPVFLPDELLLLMLPSVPGCVCSVLPHTEPDGNFVHCEELQESTWLVSLLHTAFTLQLRHQAAQTIFTGPPVRAAVREGAAQRNCGKAKTTMANQNGRVVCARANGVNGGLAANMNTLKRYFSPATILWYFELPLQTCFQLADRCASCRGP